jgi:surfeit locus 1 family protein
MAVPVRGDLLVGRVAGHRGTVGSLLGPAVAIAAALAILVALGAWQLQRLAWKESVLADIARSEAAAPAPLPSDPAPLRPAPFSKVEVGGTLRDVGLYGVAVRPTPAGEREGAFRLGVIDRPEGAPAVLVNEGWVPDGTPLDPAPRTATVVGYIRPGEAPRWFMPKGDPASRHFYSPDPAGIGAALGLPPLAPFVVVALGDVPPGTYPQPARHLPQPANNHLQYALTWFGLAAVLLGVFAAFAWQTVRAQMTAPR